jgi:hypothetical protein
VLEVIAVFSAEPNSGTITVGEKTWQSLLWVQTGSSLRHFGLMESDIYLEGHWRRVEALKHRP